MHNEQKKTRKKVYVNQTDIMWRFTNHEGVTRSRDKKERMYPKKQKKKE